MLFRSTLLLVFLFASSLVSVRGDDFCSALQTRSDVPLQGFVAYYMSVRDGKPDEKLYEAATANWNASSAWVADQLFNHGHSQNECSRESQDEGAILTVLGEVLDFKHGGRFLVNPDALRTEYDMLMPLADRLGQAHYLDASLWIFMAAGLRDGYVAAGVASPPKLTSRLSTLTGTHDQ